VLALIGGLIINYLAGSYASLHAGRPVHDLVLDRVPALPVNFIFVDGALAFWAFVLAVLLSCAGDTARSLAPGAGVHAHRTPGD
jgi:hypothetical protein